MKKDFKNYLLGLLKLRHRHLDPFTKQPSMSEALKCNECGEQVAKAQAKYNQRRKEYPEEFVYRRPEFNRSPALERSYEMLMDRIKKDELYRRHLNRLAHGTEKEKDEEIKKSNDGYYQKHYSEGGSIKRVK